MKGNPEIIATLNKLLTGELTSMDMYFLQSEICQDWGYNKLYARLNHEFDDERGHATQLIKRILLLEGSADIKSRQPFTVGDTVREMIEQSLKEEYEVAKNLNDAIEQCVSLGDNGTREILAVLLEDTESDHIFWLESQLTMMDQMGMENYLQQQM